MSVIGQDLDNTISEYIAVTGALVIFCETHDHPSGALPCFSFLQIIVVYRNLDWMFVSGLELILALD